MLVPGVRTIFFVVVVLACALLLTTSKFQSSTSQPSSALSTTSQAENVVELAPTNTSDILGDTSRRDADVTSPISTTDVLALLGWRPALLTAQVLQVRSLGWHGKIVFLCPAKEDVDMVHRTFSLNANATVLYGPTEAHFVPVRNRVSLYNGRYFIIASLHYVKHLRNELSSSGSTANSTRVIAVDASRALWCHDLFRGRFSLTFAASSVHPNHYYAKRLAQADIFSHLPKFASEKPSKLAVKAVASRRRMIVFSHVFGGHLGPLHDALSALVEATSNVAPGLAIEHIITDVIVRSFLSNAKWIPSHAPSRLERCFGHGVEAEVTGTCNGAFVKKRTRMRGERNADDGTMVLNFGACGPLTPRLQSKQQAKVVPREAQSVEHCRRLYTNGSVLSVNPLPQPRQTLLQVLASRKAGLLSLWKQFTFRGLHVVQESRKVSCPSGGDSQMVDVVLGVAFGYTAEKLKMFVGTFLRHHTVGRSKLILFVKPEHIQGMATMFNSTDVILVDGWPYLIHHSPVAGCNIVLSRFGMMRNYLRAAMTRIPTRPGMQLPPEELQCMRNVLVVDTRDTVFQQDPFVALQTLLSSQQRGLNDFFVMPMEKLYLGESDFFYNMPYRLNRLWIVQTFGATFFHTLMNEPITGSRKWSDGVTFPILCGGLYLGSIAAIVDFFEVFIESAVALGGCSINDQGLLIGMVAVGLTESRFPHPVLLSDPYTTPFTNGPRGGGEIVWDSQGRVVNCHGAPYSVMHQYTHLNAFVEHFSYLS